MQEVLDLTKTCLSVCTTLYKKRFVADFFRYSSRTTKPHNTNHVSDSDNSCKIIMLYLWQQQRAEYTEYTVFYFDFPSD